MSLADRIARLEARRPASPADPVTMAALDLLDDGENQQVNRESLNTLLSNLITYYATYIQQGQTEWIDAIDAETFHRAKAVMKSLIEANQKQD